MKSFQPYPSPTTITHIIIIIVIFVIIVADTQIDSKTIFSRIWNFQNEFILKLKIKEKKLKPKIKNYLLFIKKLTHWKIMTFSM